MGRARELYEKKRAEMERAKRPDSVLPKPNSTYERGRARELYEKKRAEMERTHQTKPEEKYTGFFQNRNAATSTRDKAIGTALDLATPLSSLFPERPKEGLSRIATPGLMDTFDAQPAERKPRGMLEAASDVVYDFAHEAANDPTLIPLMLGEGLGKRALDTAKAKAIKEVIAKKAAKRALASSALKMIGKRAAIGAGLGSVVPGIGNLSGLAIGAALAIPDIISLVKAGKLLYTAGKAGKAAKAVDLGLKAAGAFGVEGLKAAVSTEADQLARVWQQQHGIEGRDALSEEEKKSAKVLGTVVGASFKGARKGIDKLRRGHSDRVLASEGRISSLAGKDEVLNRLNSAKAQLGDEQATQAARRHWFGVSDEFAGTTDKSTAQETFLSEVNDLLNKGNGKLFPEAATGHEEIVGEVRKAIRKGKEGESQHYLRDLDYRAKRAEVRASKLEASEKAVAAVDDAITAIDADVQKMSAKIKPSAKQKRLSVRLDKLNSEREELAAAIRRKKTADAKAPLQAKLSDLDAKIHSVSTSISELEKAHADEVSKTIAQSGLLKKKEGLLAQRKVAIRKAKAQARAQAKHNAEDSAKTTAAFKQFRDEVIPEKEYANLTAKEKAEVDKALDRAFNVGRGEVHPGEKPRVASAEDRFLARYIELSALDKQIVPEPRIKRYQDAALDVLPKEHANQIRAKNMLASFAAMLRDQIVNEQHTNSTSSLAAILETAARLNPKEFGPILKKFSFLHRNRQDVLAPTFTSLKALDFDFEKMKKPLSDADFDVLKQFFKENRLQMHPSRKAVWTPSSKRLSSAEWANTERGKKLSGYSAGETQIGKLEKDVEIFNKALSKEEEAMRKRMLRAMLSTRRYIVDPMNWVGVEIGRHAGRKKGKR